MSRISGIVILVLEAIFAVSPAVQAAARKTHTVVLGATRKVPYTKAGLPVGMQVLARHFGEGMAFRVARAVEQTI